MMACILSFPTCFTGSTVYSPPAVCLERRRPLLRERASATRLLNTVVMIAASSGNQPLSSTGTHPNHSTGIQLLKPMQDVGHNKSFRGHSLLLPHNARFCSVQIRASWRLQMIATAHKSMPSHQARSCRAKPIIAVLTAIRTGLS